MQLVAKTNKTATFRNPLRSHRQKAQIRSCRRIGHAIGCLAFFSIADHARAQAWINPAGGLWENPDNWSGDVVPYDPKFNLATGSPYVVTMSSQELPLSIVVQDSSVVLNNAAHGKALMLTEGSLTINSSAGQTSSFTYTGTAVDGADGSQLTIGFSGIQNSYAAVIGGSGSSNFTVNDSLLYNYGYAFIFQPGSTFTANSSNIESRLLIQGSATYNASIGAPNISNYGSGMGVEGSKAPAVLNLLNGSQFNSTSGGLGITIGSTALDVSYPGGPFQGYQTGTGIVNVSRSTITALKGDAVDGLVDVGSTGGVGYLNIANDSQVSAMQVAVGATIPGDAPAGVGTLTLTDPGSVVTATVEFDVGKGTINISNGGKVTTPAFNLASGSTLGITLDDPDAVTVSGQALLAGTLNITLGSAADPTLGQTYDLLTFTTESGTFSTINLPPLDPGLSWSTTQLYTNGTISVVTAVPEPASVGMLITVSSLLARRRRRVEAI